MMKKMAYLAMILLFMVTFVGCESNSISSETPEDTPIVEMEDWGIALTTTDVTPTGLTIVCEQADGEQQGRLQTGTAYWVEIYDGNTWQAVPYLPDEYSISWTAEALTISFNDTTEWSVDWEWLYGELPTGTYRIGKSVSDFVEGLTSEKQTYYATFVIE